MNTLLALISKSMSTVRKAAYVAVLASVMCTAVSVESASAAGATVSAREHRAATGAVQRVEREMRADGAHRATLQGCWVDANAVECTGVVYGRDADIKWRCIVLLTVRKGKTRLVARATDAVCTAEEAVSGRRHAAAR